MDGIDFELGQGDANVPWTQAIYDSAGNQIDPTGGSVLVHYRINDDSVVAVEAAGTVVPVAGQASLIRFTFASAPAPGIYWIIWIVTLVSGEIVTWPACAGRSHQTFEVVAKP